MMRISSWSGRYSLDHLYSHRAGVRACRLLPVRNLLATGSLDRTVKLWSLSSGLPVASSKACGGTVRCVALDEDLLVSGSADARTWLFYARDGGAGGDSVAPLFDLSRPLELSNAHTGPVSSLCLSDRVLYSGSWDCTGVSAVAARGKHLIVAAGEDVFIHDQETGQVVRKFQGLHEGRTAGIEGTRNSRMLFSAGSEGLVLAHDLRMKNPTRVVWHHREGVQSLAFEDPWLASASADGTVMMVNTEARQLPPSRGLPSLPNQHLRQLLVPAGPAYCVDLADQWVVAGSESETVRVWDFTRANEAAEKAASAKQARNQRRKYWRRSAGAAQHQPGLVVRPANPAPQQPPTTGGARHRGAGDRGDRARKGKENGEGCQRHHGA